MKVRFSILSLLMLTFVIAAILGGFRYGSQRGYDRGYVHGEQALQDKMPWSTTYPLNEIKLDEEIADWDWPFSVRGHGKAQLVRWMVIDRIGPEQWADMGGPFSIQHSEEREELAVFAPKATQDEIASLLNDLSASPDKLARFAREKLQEAKERASVEEELALRQLQPATELLSGPFEVLNRDVVLVGSYSVTMAKSSKPMIACLVFYPGPDGIHGGVKVRYKNEEKHPPLSQDFAIWGTGRIHIGTTTYSAGRIDEQLVLVSDGEPKEILVLSDQSLPPGEETGGRELE